MNTALSGNGRADDIKGHRQGEIRGQTNLVKPESRRKLAREPFAKKIRKIGDLTRLSHSVKREPRTLSGLEATKAMDMFMSERKREREL